jgi:hypothetical protein
MGDSEDTGSEPVQPVEPIQPIVPVNPGQGLPDPDTQILERGNPPGDLQKR